MPFASFGTDDDLRLCPPSISRAISVHASKSPFWGALIFSETSTMYPSLAALVVLLNCCTFLGVELFFLLKVPCPLNSLNSSLLFHLNWSRHLGEYAKLSQNDIMIFGNKLLNYYLDPKYYFKITQNNLRNTSLNALNERRLCRKSPALSLYCWSQFVPYAYFC